MYINSDTSLSGQLKPFNCKTIVFFCFRRGEKKKTSRCMNPVLFDGIGHLLVIGEQRAEPKIIESISVARRGLPCIPPSTELSAASKHSGQKKKMLNRIDC